ncbi:MAG TPA: tetratricopeptide repeat protein [Novimethylophilus sp.]|jgi:tetratricopeptide (TPR) repeat protein|uniref:tetratricopeptide repeat protein n=1 Tax=Novimethylophilus sp. TaxID=2137426 RepID=UPI002F401462
MTASEKRFPAGRILFQMSVLFMAVAAMYGHFLSNPLVFDDHGFFEGNDADFLRAFLNFNLRALPYATFGWTRSMAGEEMVWLRLGNLALHIANGFLLFLFLRRLFAIAVPEAGTDSRSGRSILSSDWFAFAGALLFTLHPAAVYGVAYLVQRTILMATLFGLATWLLFLEGMVRNKQSWLLASALTYLLATLSKEHAIMVPAVAFALLLLVRQPGKKLFAQVWPTFVLYGLIGIFIVFQVKFGNIIGQAYEPNGASMLSMLDIDAREIYPLSILTQSFLYFKYLSLWLVPDIARMSVDMRAGFATRLWIWPETAGFLAFAVYPVVALRLLWQQGRTGLLGFAMLCPWLLFATELSTVRIQEIFVLYRSYLWMPCVVAALPFLLQKLSARQAVAVLAVMILGLVPLTWNRLSTFAEPIRLWDDALRLAQHSSNPTGLGRIYHNRGVAYLNAQHYAEAIRDFDAGLKLLPAYSRLYNDRAVAYLQTGRYMEALNDYDEAIWFDPNYYNPYLGRAKVYEALGNQTAARQDYEQACSMGVQEVCGL